MAAVVASYGLCRACVPALGVLETLALFLALPCGAVSSFGLSLGLGLRCLIYFEASLLPLCHDSLVPGVVVVVAWSTSPSIVGFLLGFTLGLLGGHALVGCGVAVGVVPGAPGVLDLNPIGPITVLDFFFQPR